MKVRERVIAPVTRKNEAWNRMTAAQARDARRLRARVPAEPADGDLVPIAEYLIGVRDSLGAGRSSSWEPARGTRT